MKKVLSLCMALLFAVALLGCSVRGDAMPESHGLAIIFTNDVHGYYAATDDNFGHDYLAAVADGYKSAVPATFILDAGDATQGTFFVNDNRGLAAIEIMNAVGYDAMTLGNHEFDFGTDNINRLKDAANFPFLSQVDGFASTVIVERGGVRLGVFGITTANTRRSSGGGFDVDFGTVESQIEYAEDCVAELKADGADFIVCLSHLGVTDTGEGTSYDIRDRVDGIDVIIDGHSHTRPADIVQEANKAPIVSAGEYANAIGILEAGSGVIQYNDWTRSNFKGLTAVAPVTEVIDKWRRAADAAGDAVIGHSGVAAPYDRNTTRTQETALGDLIADAVRAVSGANIAFVAAGDIWASLDAGDITVKDAYSILPYINHIQTAKVQGRVIKEALTLSISALPGAAGGFLQVSGLAFEYGENGVTAVYVGDAPLDENAVYTLAVNDWLSSGGDGYDMLVEPFKETIPNAEADLSTMTDVLTWYLGTLPSDYIPQTEDRIRFGD